MFGVEVGMWGWCCVCVKSASNVVRVSLERCPDGGVQDFSGGEYRFV